MRMVTTSENHGSTASKLGALNAAHASDTALANASPNSRVGKIAAYKEAELAAKAATADAAAADQKVADAQADYADAFAAADTDVDGVTSTPMNADAGADGRDRGRHDRADDAQAAAATADATAQAAQDEADAALVNAANKDITDDERQRPHRRARRRQPPPGHRLIASIARTTTSPAPISSVRGFSFGNKVRADRVHKDAGPRHGPPC